MPKRQSGRINGRSAHHLTAALRNQACGALVARMDPEPADRDAEPVAQADQEIDVRDAPYPPRDRAVQLEAPQFDHRLVLADLRQAAGVLVLERRELAAAQARLDQFGDIASLLLGRRRNAGHRLSIGARDDDGVANRKDIGMARYGEIGQYLQPAGTVGGSAEPFGGRGSAHAGGPDQGSRLQALATIDD